MYVSIQYDRKGTFLVRETPRVSTYREYWAYIISSTPNAAVMLVFMLADSVGCNDEISVTITVSNRHCKLVAVSHKYRDQ